MQRLYAHEAVLHRGCHANPPELGIQGSPASTKTPFSLQSRHVSSMEQGNMIRFCAAATMPASWPSSAVGVVGLGAQQLVQGCRAFLQLHLGPDGKDALKTAPARAVGGFRIH